MADYAAQRRKRMKRLREQDGLSIPKNASPKSWDAPPDNMNKNGNANYTLPTPETKRRYNISKES